MAKNKNWKSIKNDRKVNFKAFTSIIFIERKKFFWRVKKKKRIEKW